MKKAFILFLLIPISMVQPFAQTQAPGLFTPDELSRIREDGVYRAQHDWAFLTRYQAENAALKPPAPGENRVVFMGNSITEFWKVLDPAFFEGRPFINRGISGQTSPQMLLRFRQDVIDLHPAVVIINAGVNDIAGNTGPASMEMIQANIQGMVELARAHHIRVILSTVLPAYAFPWSPGIQPARQIILLNNWIRNYATANDIVFLDYFTPMADERNGLLSSFSEDGVHPNLTGYRVMEPLALEAIGKALGKNQASPGNP